MVGELYNACKVRAASGEALALACEANVYLDRKAPWFQIKEDRQAAATTVYVSVRSSGAFEAEGTRGVIGPRSR